MYLYKNISVRYISFLPFLLKMGLIEDKLACQAKCRDGTACLNKSKGGVYCWKHQESLLEGDQKCQNKKFSNSSLV